MSNISSKPTGTVHVVQNLQGNTTLEGHEIKIKTKMFDKIISS